MAIKVGGTTVIDDSRNLSNVGGLKTVGGTNILGSGDISVGGSTTWGAVGTYTVAFRLINGQQTISGGSTISGSSLRHLKDAILNFFASSTDADLINPNYSGTWRMMTDDMKNNQTAGNSRYQSSLFVRIS